VTNPGQASKPVEKKGGKKPPLGSSEAKKTPNIVNPKGDQERVSPNENSHGSKTSS